MTTRAPWISPAKIDLGSWSCDDSGIPGEVYATITQRGRPTRCRLVRDPISDPEPVLAMEPTDIAGCFTVAVALVALWCLMAWGAVEYGKRHPHVVKQGPPSVQITP